MKKKKVGIIFGGKSAEHEVSLQSAKNIVDAIDKDKYEVTLIGIAKDGKWHLNDQSSYLLNAENPRLISLNKSNDNVAIVPGSASNQLIHVENATSLEQLDVIFPIVHGTLGEDGSLQGMLRMANLPFVGPSVLGSSICMDKDIAKRLLHAAGINVAKGIVVKRSNKDKLSYKEISEKLGVPMFVKPANQGSSVGVSKVKTEEEFRVAIEEAFQYDHKVVIEENIVGREIECAVLGNDDPIASIPGEVLPNTDFYSYESKYIDEKGAELAIPAELSEEQVKKVQQVAIEAFKTLECEGLARVDFFLTNENKLYVNEVNTLPGFTKISMYPKLWEISGIPYTELISKLIDLAVERHQNDSNLKSTVWD
ncbi:D-alanine--D-alanine ligase [Ornithinibacillus halotolerans]|uniref:D-alanine--D-alanine ligase n=1 Tax=Ornithinibacillus halotolerans TaxID=1274357 RepID=A0A916S5S5_9BACI|nr:D-alanine--D-alanine ligase [Ornithinibacillus halotolerans]GGA84926.1 D-alanine--D-alanine ligase [Ornithinibacillus halotolerans]